jgi:hypothetical protein
MVAGVLTRNMANDFFVRDGALLFWALAGMLFGYSLRRGSTHEGIHPVFGKRERADVRPFPRTRTRRTASWSSAQAATPRWSSARSPRAGW